MVAGTFEAALEQMNPSDQKIPEPMARDFSLPFYQ
jgi:hypothetical protein